MKKFKLETNNSKKLIIGVSILFCTVILIIGGSIAFFTQSGSESIGNLVTTDINGTIGYSDNNDYMRNNLIPVKETDVSLFAMKNSSHSSGKYTNDDICKYQDGMYACSLYQFTITNNADVTQELMVTLNPYPNEFANLYYILYEGEQDKLTTSTKNIKSSTHIDSNNSSEMVNGLVLKPKESKTYTVVFYIKNLENIDQTADDAGKHFGAIIRVDSITTGTYLSISVGETCYEMEDLNDGTYKLTKFNGINKDGTMIDGCGVTQDTDGFYNVTIPSVIGGNKVSTLGNGLFLAVDIQAGSANNYSKIKNIVVSEGITTLESGFFDIASGLGTGTFAGVGFDYIKQQPVVDEVIIDLPNSLTDIGTYSFMFTNIKELSIPRNVTELKDNSLVFSVFSDLTFEGAFDGTSKLEIIGSYILGNFQSRFEYNANVTSLIIPSSVKVIKDNAFNSGKYVNNISELVFVGAEDGSSQLQTIGSYAFEDAKISSLVIPYSVTQIGDYAFDGNDNLTSLTFTGSLTEINENNRLTIGESSFYDCELTYETNDNPLIIPARVSSIGNDAFTGDASRNLKLNFIKYMGPRTTLDTFGTNWYKTEYATVTAIDD